MTNCSFLALLFLCLCCISFTQALTNGFSVELIHRNSPRSPFYSPTETKFQRVANVVRRSINHANHFNKASVPTNTPQTTIIPDRGEYLMSYSIGTPHFKFYGIVDTGSDIVWLQCKPCVNCYNQTTPIFDPSKSRTYRTIPCTSSRCRSWRSTTCFPKRFKNCEYSINYSDGSHSQGDLIVDTLILGSTNGSLISFPRTVIGCGHDNTVLFQGQNSGIVGLGRGPVSLITQLDPSIGGKFSYCLVPMFSEPNFSSKLSFGDDAIVSGRGTVSTPILSDRDQNVFYFLTLKAFSVGDKRIEFENPSSETSQEGNIIIDSGTTLTLLREDFYSRLESAVADVVKLKRVKDPTQQLSLCYEIGSRKLEVPIITAHFSGADVHLSSLNTFVHVDEGIVCFAFRSIQTGAIFGNLAQQNFLVGYDLQKKIVSFKPTDCIME